MVVVVVCVPFVRSCRTRCCGEPEGGCCVVVFVSFGVRLWFWCCGHLVNHEVGGGCGFARVLCAVTLDSTTG